MRAKKENEKHRELGLDQVRDLENTATKGIRLGSRLSINDIILARTPGLLFDLGKSVKSVSGVSRDDNRGENTVRFYTNDDYFLQIEYFGKDFQENVGAAMIFHYLDDECEDVDRDNEEQVAKWMEMIEETESIEIQGQTFTRMDSNTFSGIEIVELEDEEINSLENYFNVFSRDVSATITEYLIINLEQEIEMDHDTGEIVSYGNATGSMAIGTDLPLLKVEVQNLKN